MSEHGTPDAFLRNIIEYPASPARKALLIIRNLSLRPIRLAQCCGHPGEPGC